MSEQTIDEFVQTQRSRDFYVEFRTWYAVKHKEDPYSWPETLTQEEWFDTFRDFMSVWCRQ